MAEIDRYHPEDRRAVDALYRRVFEMAEAKAGKPLPRAVVPRIQLQSAKFTRAFTTENFAQRVVQRHRACLARGGKVAASDWPAS